MCSLKVLSSTGRRLQSWSLSLQLLMRNLYILSTLTWLCPHRYSPDPSSLDSSSSPPPPCNTRRSSHWCPTSYWRFWCNTWGRQRQKDTWYWFLDTPKSCFLLLNVQTHLQSWAMDPGVCLYLDGQGISMLMLQEWQASRVLSTVEFEQKFWRKRTQYEV